MLYEIREMKIAEVSDIKQPELMTVLSALIEQNHVIEKVELNQQTGTYYVCAFILVKSDDIYIPSELGDIEVDTEKELAKVITADSTPMDKAKAEYSDEVCVCGRSDWHFDECDDGIRVSCLNCSLTEFLAGEKE